MQYTIDKHISNLLFSQECVVIPEFGAFLTRYFPSEINTATHMMRPPSRRVVFNERIQENDGLLAKYIAQVEDVSYEKALQSIGISVRSWKKILRAGKKINLQSIGRLFLDDQNYLQFNPGLDVNYHAASYGLNIFRASAMEREDEIKRSVNRAIEGRSKKPQARKSQTKDTNPLPNATRKSWVRYVAVLGPVAAIILVGSYLYTQEPQTYQNISGYVSDFFSPPKVEQKSREDKPEKGEAGMMPYADSTSGKSADSKNADYDLEAAEKDEAKLNSLEESTSNSEYAAEPREVVEPEPTPAPKTPSQSATTSSQSLRKGMGIVVGSFSQDDNAQSYASKLQAQGFETRTMAHNNMTRVVIGNYIDRGEAMYKLNKIKQDVNAQAWLYLP